MSAENIVYHVLTEYPAACRPRRIGSLQQAGGFSGARFWRLETVLGSLCLRRWPREYPDATQLAFIHDVLRHVSRRGFKLAPVPLAVAGGSERTFVQRQEFLWELTPWLSGAADFHDRPSRTKLVAALQVLAQFHLAASDYPAGQTTVGPSAGIQSRCEVVQRWKSGDMAALVAAIGAGSWPDLRGVAERIVERFEFASATLSARLQRAAQITVPQQPCIRDVWDQHVLFLGDVVTGLIDFGAMKMDTVGTDIARLLGSLAADNAEDWQAGLDAYQQLRPLSPAEQELIGTFDFSIVLLSGLNWLRWIYLEKREFPDEEAVFSRLTAILARLDHVKQ